MEQSLLPQKINVYALLPHGFMPTFHKYDDKLLFGNFFQYPDRNTTFQGTFTIHYILAYTNVDRTTIEQAFNNLSSSSWRDLILDYINSVVDNLPQFEQLYVENSIRTHLPNIEDLISNFKNDLLNYPGLGCPLIYALTKFVRSLYPLFFLKYECSCNKYQIALDSDDKLEQVTKQLTFIKTDGGEKILRRFEQNGIEIRSIVSGIPPSELTKWIQNGLNLEKTYVRLRGKYFQIMDPVVAAIRRRPTTSTVTNTLVDYIPVIVEFVYTREQIQKIMHLFDSLFIQLSLLCTVNQDTLKLLEYFYLHFAVPYYLSGDNDDTVSVLWIFPYTSFVGSLCDLNDSQLRGTKEYFRICEQLPSTYSQIDRLYTKLYLYMPPYLYPLIVQDILNQRARRKTNGWCRKINALHFPENTVIQYTQFIGSGLITTYIFPILKQIINEYTDLTTISLTTLYMPQDIVRFELILKAIRVHMAIHKQFRIYPIFEYAEKLLEDRYDISQLICSTAKEYNYEETHLFVESDYYPISNLHVTKSRNLENSVATITLKYFDDKLNATIPLACLSNVEHLLELPHHLKDTKLHLYHICPV